MFLSNRQGKQLCAKKYIAHTCLFPGRCRKERHIKHAPSSASCPKLAQKYKMFAPENCKNTKSIVSTSHIAAVNKQPDQVYATLPGLQKRKYSSWKWPALCSQSSLQPTGTKCQKLKLIIFNHKIVSHVQLLNGTGEFKPPFLHTSLSKQGTTLSSSTQLETKLLEMGGQFCVQHHFRRGDE